MDSACLKDSCKSSELSNLPGSVLEAMRNTLKGLHKNYSGNKVNWMRPTIKKPKAQKDHWEAARSMEGNIEILNLNMKPGNTLKVKGKISADTVGFSINLGCSSRDLAFHFNPRFNESVIVCNSKCSDSWQTEHRDRHLPFFRGCTVKFFIEMLSDKFRVKLPDGHEVCFPNRHGYRNINYISIMGGLKIISFKLS